jgi:hypothetical protein
MSVIINGTSGISTDGGSELFGSGSIGGSLTLTSGTANGVTYLNGSKVLTSGSALTFDGTSFGVGHRLMVMLARLVFLLGLLAQPLVACNCGALQLQSIPSNGVMGRVVQTPIVAQFLTAMPATLCAFGQVQPKKCA